MAAITAENLTKFYGRTRGIEGVNLEVREGEVFGFLGPNGAGKTTTIRLLLDFIRPTRGRATVLGLDPQRDSLAVRARVAYLPGEPGLYDHMTGEEYLAYMASFRPGADRARRRRIAERLEAVLDRRIKTLSRGMKQKIALVQALQHAADLLILDEPTSGLDPLMQHVFYDLLREERKAGRTVFMCSHVLSEVERVCDRVAIIRNGAIALVEDVAALTRKRVKKVQVAFSAPLDREHLAVAGVRDLTVTGPAGAPAAWSATFRAEASALPAVVKALASLPVTDVAIENPSLEDIFFEYFGAEAAAEVARAQAEPGGARGGRRWFGRAGKAGGAA